MSTNKTPNYNLHSWLPQDEFHVTEINENFTKLDASLKAESTAAAQKAAVLESALAAGLSPRPRMVTGSYTGKTSATDSSQSLTTVTLGFKPRAVIVLNTNRGISGVDLYFMAVENQASNTAVVLTDTGFTAKNDGQYGPRLNYPCTYHYTAFY